MLSSLVLSRAKGDPKVIASGPSSLSRADSLARGLGWCGIGLGIFEILAPQRVARMIGMESEAIEPVIRIYGLREIGTGVLTLSPDRVIGMWGRVAGDVLDVATLAKGLTRSNSRRSNVAAALMAVLGVTALDVLAANKITAQRARRSGTRRYLDRSGFPKGRDTQRTLSRSQRPIGQRELH